MNIFRLGYACLFLLLCLPNWAAAPNQTFHSDHRAGIPKLMTVSSSKSAPGLNDSEKAADYLAANAHVFGLPAGAANMELQSVRHSLLGSHYTYQQMLHGHKVAGGTIVVSISAQNGEVYQVYKP